MRPSLATSPQAHWWHLALYLSFFRIRWHGLFPSSADASRAQGEGAAEVRGGLGLVWGGSATVRSSKDQQFPLLCLYLARNLKHFISNWTPVLVWLGPCWRHSPVAALAGGWSSEAPASCGAWWWPLVPGLQQPHELHIPFQMLSTGLGLICKSPLQFTSRVAYRQFCPGNWAGLGWVSTLWAGLCWEGWRPQRAAWASPFPLLCAGSAQTPWPCSCAVSLLSFTGNFWACGTSGTCLIWKLFLFVVVGFCLCKFRIWLSPGIDILY